MIYMTQERHTNLSNSGSQTGSSSISHEDRGHSNLESTVVQSLTEESGSTSPGSGTIRPRELQAPWSDHYQTMGLQPLDVMKQNCRTLEVRGFMFGEALKHLMRYDRKNGEEDLDKALWWIQQLKQWVYHRDNT